MHGVPSFLGFFPKGIVALGVLKKKVKKGKNIAFGQQPLGSAAWLISGVQGHEKAEKAQQKSEKHNIWNA